MQLNDTLCEAKIVTKVCKDQYSICKPRSNVTLKNVLSAHKREGCKRVEMKCSREFTLFDKLDNLLF